MPIDKGTSKPITQLSSLQINYKDEYSCFNPPIVTTEERNDLVNTDNPEKPIKDGTLIFNSDTGYEEYYSGDKWIEIKEGGGGTGDVIGPANATDNNIAVFDGTTGKKIKDGGPKVDPMNRFKKGKNATPLYKLSNLGALQFGSNDNVADTGVILVDSLTPVTFQTQGTEADSRVCTVINGEEGAGSSSPSALLEINSSVGGFLHARMTTAQRDSLLDPKDGLEVYNTDTKNLNIRQNGAWVEIKSGGNGNVVGPSSSTENSLTFWKSNDGKIIESSDITVSDHIISAQGTKIKSTLNNIGDIIFHYSAGDGIRKIYTDPNASEGVFDSNQIFIDGDLQINALVSGISVYSNNKNAKFQVFLDGEIGGLSEIEISDLNGTYRITKPYTAASGTDLRIALPSNKGIKGQFLRYTDTNQAFSYIGTTEWADLPTNYAYKLVWEDYTLLESDTFIETKANLDITLTLGNISGSGKLYIIKNNNPNGNVVTILGGAGGPIDGNPSITINKNQCVSLVQGAGWSIVSKF